MNIKKVIDIKGIIMYYRNCGNEINETINKDKTDSYIIKIKYNNWIMSEYFNKRSVYCDIKSLFIG